MVTQINYFFKKNIGLGGLSIFGRRLQKQTTFSLSWRLSSHASLDAALLNGGAMTNGLFANHTMFSVLSKLKRHYWSSAVVLTQVGYV